MKRAVLIILVAHRKGSAVYVQKILTDWGCLIKTRLGIHDGVLNKCSDTGLIILELVGDQKKKKELADLSPLIVPLGIRDLPFLERLFSPVPAG